MFGPCFVIFSSFAIILMGVRGSWLLSLIVFLMSYDCYQVLCCVTLSRGAVGSFVVCDCGISWSDSLTFEALYTYYATFTFLVMQLLHFWQTLQA